MQNQDLCHEYRILSLSSGVLYYKLHPGIEETVFRRILAVMVNPIGMQVFLNRPLKGSISANNVFFSFIL
jgi:hypothetical protein